MDLREQITTFLKENGPSVPTAIAKSLKKESLFISAFLSEMKETGKIKISNIKIGGGSPLYYLPGQEEKIQEFSSNLSEKDKQFFDLLKEKKVVRDINLVPVFRLSARQIKDFSFSLEVSFDGKNEIFWKWYLCSDEDATEIIKDILGMKKKESIPIPEKKYEENKTVQINEIKKVDENISLSKESEKQQTLKKVDEKKYIKKEEYVQKEKSKADFIDELRSYLNQNNIKIIDEISIKKSSEVDFIVELPSVVGGLLFYLKAKNKKKINEGDISSALIEGKSKGLSVIFLSKGDLNKKAEQILCSNEFRSMKFKRI